MAGGLVLTREVGEIVHIGTDIEVMVTQIRGDKVRLRIVAPSTVPILRKEVADAIRAEDLRAATPATVGTESGATGEARS